MTDYACALIIQDGKLLLGRRALYRKTYADKWDVIGGKVEPGENLEEALIRELGEEIGISPLNSSAFDVISDTGRDPKSPPKYHYFLVTRWQGTPSICNHEHSELQWFPFEEAAALPDLAIQEYAALFIRLSLVETHIL